MEQEPLLKLRTLSNSALAMEKFAVMLCDDQFSVKLLRNESGVRIIPILCNTTLSVELQQSSGVQFQDFCTKVWETCGNVSIFNSSLEPFLQDKAGKDLGLCLCETFSGTSEDAKVSFFGEPNSLNKIHTPPLPKGLCLEKIRGDSYLNMVPHPDGPNRAFFANIEGKIWLANIPNEGSNEVLEIDESKTFLDLSNDILIDSGHGLMGIAFHPNFSINGRFFVSYNCDQMRNPICSGRCACNSDVNCDPLELGPDDGWYPPIGHAGQILFGPEDGYLYLMLADGSNRDDPHNFAQNKRSLLGKILRIDVNNVPSTKEINDKGLWGNYSIPRDNPYVNDKEFEPEIWAIGFKNPWRCSFDSQRPSYFLCGDAGQDQYEEIDMVKKGQNYGWRIYEGPFLFHPSQSHTGNTSISSINPIFPILGYSHSDIDNITGSANIIGGYFYRSMTDPCLYGRYLYTDLYAGSIMVGIESPESSRNFSSAKITSRCAHDSPMPCSFVHGSPTPSLGYVYSLAEDNNKDIYYLTSTGVYRVARPSRCNYLCTSEKVDDSIDIVYGKWGFFFNTKSTHRM
ncbi:unnamed protein product [Lupinus luteus]|uniref:Glucose/Sorbosone dehydrogenase domain-containing protein n=1 Tax=Lupinus luteus TaxID=3873 RepID=A0AAV1XF20_LUPLU